jgi:hypothetical protein
MNEVRGYVACFGVPHKILLQKVKETDHLGDTGVNGRIILKLIVNKLCGLDPASSEYDALEGSR